MLGMIAGNLQALDFEVIQTTDEQGKPLVIERIKVLSVLHLFTTQMKDQPMVELSALAWSEDENLLYALSDHGSLFHFRPVFRAEQLTSIELLDAFPLRSSLEEKLSYPWSDSEGLYLRNGSNGIMGDDELLVSFENRPRLQWHRPDGGWIRNEPLAGWMEDPSSYYRRGKALESVAVHPQYGVITAPEYPLDEADWSQLTIYLANGEKLVTERDEEKDFALCAIEVMPDGRLLSLQRRHSLFAPTWSTRLEILAPLEDDRLRRIQVADIDIGESRLPVDNYEGLTRHRNNRYFMISDDNEHFIQQTLLVYFELLD